MREGDLLALRIAAHEFARVIRHGVVTVVDVVTAAINSLRARLFPAPAPAEPRFVLAVKPYRTVGVLHDRQTDRLIPVLSEEAEAAAEVLVLHPGAFYATESPRADVVLATKAGEVEVVLPGVTL